MIETINKNAKVVSVVDLGCIGYYEAYEKQQEYVRNVQRGDEDAIILCEHPPVITKGRLSQDKNIIASVNQILDRGVALKNIDRGGDVTLHAPGQLVVYPIFNLNKRGRDLRRYLRSLEEVAISLLGDFGIVGSRHPTQTGVWVKNKKIASIGIGVKKWVTYHGLAVNVNTDLSLFSLIRPCGLDVSMTSIAAIKQEPIEMQIVKKLLLTQMAKVFSYE